MCIYICIYIIYKFSYVCVLTHIQIFASPWAVAHQAPLSMGFSRQEYWSGLSCSPPGDLPNPGIEPASPKSPALAGKILYHWATWEAPKQNKQIKNVTWFKNSIFEVAN